MSDKSTPNFIILGGGPMALLSAYYINLLIPSASIVILDKRGYYSRSNFTFTINPKFIEYLKTTFKDNDKFIEFLDILTNVILNNCNTFRINMLEENLYKKLQYKIFIIKCNISLDNGELSIFPTMDQIDFWINVSTNAHPPDGTIIIKIINEKNEVRYVDINDRSIEYIIADEKYDTDKRYKNGTIRRITTLQDNYQKQLEFLNNLKPDYILNCTGGRLNTKIYWKENAEETKKYLSDLIINCVNNSVNNMDRIKEYINKNNNNEYIFPSMETPLWYGKGFRTNDTHEVISSAQSADIISFLKPSIQINIKFVSVYKCYLFNIGDSIMRVDFRKKIGLGLGITHIKILLDIINNRHVNENLDELFVKNIEENFHTLSTPNKLNQCLPLFCTSLEFNQLYDVESKRDTSKEKQLSNFFRYLENEGKNCYLGSYPYEVPRPYEWPGDDITCTLESNPDEITVFEFYKCPENNEKKVNIIDQYNINQSQLLQAIIKQDKTSHEFNELLEIGKKLKKLLKEQNQYHLTTKLVHLEDGINLYGTRHKAGDIVINNYAETVQKTIKKKFGNMVSRFIGKKGGKVKKTKKNIYKKNFSKMKKNFNKTKRKRIKSTKKNKKKKSRR